jgi:hypothetical protein
MNLDEITHDSLATWGVPGVSAFVVMGGSSPI